MSTIVVVEKDGQIVLGADTLSKLSNTNERAEFVKGASKILSVGDSYIASVGHASWGLVLKDYFENLKRPPSLGSVEEIFSEALEMHAVLKEKYYLNVDEDREQEFESSRGDFLIANKNGIFGLYSFRSVRQYSRYFAFGTGYRIALGAMHAVYDLKYSAKRIAECGLSAAAVFDEDTGAPFDLIEIL